MANFTFTGDIFIPKENFYKESSYKDKKTGKDIASRRISFSVKESVANSQFVSLFASESPNGINAYDKDGEKITIPWNSRFDDDVIEMVSSMGKHYVDLSDADQKAELKEAIESNDFTDVAEKYGVTDYKTAKELYDALREERKTFISTYDMVKYLAENLPKYKGKITVTGRLRKRYYEGKYVDNFDIGSVYSAPSSAKNKLSIKAELVFNKDCVDKSRLKTEGKIYVSAYTSEYINSTEQNKYVPFDVVFDTSVYKPDNEKHMKLLAFKKSYIDIPNKTYQRMMFELRLVNGAEEVEFDESCLTNAQKTRIELGMKTLEDFRPRNKVFGDRVHLYKIFEPSLNGKYADGMEDTELTPAEFEEQIYNPERKKLEAEAEIEKAGQKSTEAKVEVEEDDEDDLF